MKLHIVQRKSLRDTYHDFYIDGILIGYHCASFYLASYYGGEVWRDVPNTLAIKLNPKWHYIGRQCAVFLGECIKKARQLTGEHADNDYWWQWDTEGTPESKTP